MVENFFLHFLTAEAVREIHQGGITYHISGTRIGGSVFAWIYSSSFSLTTVNIIIQDGPHNRGKGQ